MGKTTELKSFRLNSMEEPTDEQLYALMEKVGEEAGRQSRIAKERLDSMMRETREKIVARRKSYVK